jgi:uncharacterized membrane protein
MRTAFEWYFWVWSWLGMITGGWFILVTIYVAIASIWVFVREIACNGKREC